MLRDLKAIIKKDTQVTDFFFTNYQGKKLTKLLNYKGEGSLLRKFGEVTKIENFTLKKLRNALEGRIQMKDSLKENVKHINFHSLEVGQCVYDKMTSAHRSLINNNINKEDGAKKVLPDEEVTEDQSAKRAKLDAEQQEKLLEHAKKFIKRDKELLHKDFRENGLDDDKIQMMKMINEKISEFYKEGMDPTSFKIAFYRYVDSPRTPAVDKMRVIEEEIFRNFKSENCRPFKGEWRGTKANNALAEVKIR